MTNIQVKNVEPDLHEQLRRRAAEAGVTLSEYVLELIRRDLRKPARREWLERVSRLPRHDISREEILAAIDEGRAEQLARFDRIDPAGP